MTPWDFTILSLATLGLLTSWFRGQIFETMRAKVEARSGFLASLLGCVLCFSPWIASALLYFLYIPSLWIPEPWATAYRAPMYSAAAGFVAQLLYNLPAWFELMQTRSSGRSDA